MQRAIKAIIREPLFGGETALRRYDGTSLSSKSERARERENNKYERESIHSALYRGAPEISIRLEHSLPVHYALDKFAAAE